MNVSPRFPSVYDDTSSSTTTMPSKSRPPPTATSRGKLLFFHFGKSMLQKSKSFHQCCVPGGGGGSGSINEYNGDGSCSPSFSVGVKYRYAKNNESNQNHNHQRRKFYDNNIKSSTKVASVLGRTVSFNHSLVDDNRRRSSFEFLPSFDKNSENFGCMLQSWRSEELSKV